MINYTRQVVLCEAVRKTLNQALSQSTDPGMRQKSNSFPTNESILRAVSLHPSLDTEEKMKAFILEHVLNEFRLTPEQKERLNLNNRPQESLSREEQPGSRL